MQVPAVAGRELVVLRSRHPMGPLIHSDLPLKLATAPASIPEAYILRADLLQWLEGCLDRRMILIQMREDYSKPALAAAR